MTDLTRNEWLERLAKVDEILVYYVYDKSNTIHLCTPCGLSFYDINRINDEVCKVVWVGDKYVHLDYTLKDYGDYENVE